MFGMVYTWYFLWVGSYMVEFWIHCNNTAPTPKSEASTSLKYGFVSKDILESGFFCMHSWVIWSLYQLLCPLTNRWQKLTKPKKSLKIFGSGPFCAGRNLSFVYGFCISVYNLLKERDSGHTGIHICHHLHRPGFHVHVQGFALHAEHEFLVRERPLVMLSNANKGICMIQSKFCDKNSWTKLFQS